MKDIGVALPVATIGVTVGCALGAGEFIRRARNATRAVVKGWLPTWNATNKEMDGNHTFMARRNSRVPRSEVIFDLGSRDAFTRDASRAELDNMGEPSQLKAAGACCVGLVAGAAALGLGLGSLREDYKTDFGYGRMLPSIVNFALAAGHIASFGSAAVNLVKRSALINGLMARGARNIGWEQAVEKEREIWAESAAVRAAVAAHAAAAGPAAAREAEQAAYEAVAADNAAQRGDDPVLEARFDAAMARVIARREHASREALNGEQIAHATLGRMSRRRPLPPDAV